MCPFELWFSQGICPVVGLLGHMVVLFFVFLRNGHVDIVGEGEGGTNWEMRFDINTRPCVKQIASGSLL